MNVEDISHFNSRPLYATKWGSYLLDANCITPNLHQRLSRQQHTVCVCSDMEMKLFGIHVWSVSNWLRCYIMFRFQVCNEENAIRNGSQNWMMIHRDARRWMSAMSIWAWFIILVKFMVSCGLGRILAFAYEWLGRCCTYCLSCAVQHKCARCVLSMEFIQRAQKNQIIKKNCVEFYSVSLRSTRYALRMARCAVHSEHGSNGSPRKFWLLDSHGAHARLHRILGFIQIYVSCGHIFGHRTVPYMRTAHIGTHLSLIHIGSASGRLLFLDCTKWTELEACICNNNNKM